jgi:hypothetical protein
MNIHVGRNGQSLGTFTPEEIHEGIATGRFRADDIGWYEGLTDWAPLSSLGALQQPAPESSPPAANLHPQSREVSLPARSTTDVAKTANPWLKRIILWIVLLLLAAASVPLVRMIQHRAEFRLHSEKTGQVIAACKLHASKNKGAYPPDLETLLKEGLITDAKTLQDPFGQDTSPVGYHYYGLGVTDSAPADKVILISKGVNTQGDRIAAQNDGSLVMIHLPSIPPAK